MRVIELDIEKIMKFSMTAAIRVVLTVCFLMMYAASTLSQAADEILVPSTTSTVPIDTSVNDAGDNRRD
ncbi:MAG: hypothetical protein ACT4OY_07870 [Alphaproteobacteria bacterium]